MAKELRMMGTELLVYLDPASGGILLQWVVAGIIGLAGFFLKPLRRVISWWRRHDGAPADDATGAPPTTTARAA